MTAATRYNRTHRAGIGAAIALALIAGHPASAQQFFGQDVNGGSEALVHPNADTAHASFIGALTSGVGTETFESIAAGTPAPINLSFPGAGTATLTGSGLVTNTFGASDFAISGTQGYEVTASNFVVNLSNPTAAFGFYGTDIGDIGSNLNLTFSNTVSGFSQTVTVPGGPPTPGIADSTLNGNALYFGYINTAHPFNTVAFTDTPNTGDVFGFDDFTIGSVQQVRPVTVPEPGTLALLGIGGFVIAGVARRRRAR